MFKSHISSHMMPTKLSSFMPQHNQAIIIFSPNGENQLTCLTLNILPTQLSVQVSEKTIKKYEELANDPVIREIWTTAFGKELSGLAQDDNKMGAAGTNIIFFLDYEGIKLIPAYRTITYA